MNEIYAKRAKKQELLYILFYILKNIDFFICIL